ncbi:MAG TPA: hypothetical protein VD737_06035 [Steroidobacteraceae bacterium]|nr:hypothetical protein [Steroidobacteraceae bacterium]
MTVKLPLPYRRSRGLAPGNDLLGIPGVALDVVGLEIGVDLEAGWRRRVEHAALAIGWPSPAFARRQTEQGHTLAYTAPADQLQTARTANEWAVCAALVELDPCHWASLLENLPGSVPASARDAVGQDAAIDRLVRLGAAEAAAHRVS